MFKVPQNLHLSLGALSNLYFVDSGGFVKVGIADDIAKRLHILQLGNPTPLRLAARRTVPRALSLQVERLVHRELAEFAIGREWFKLSGKDAVKRADPFVKKAHATVLRWRSKGIDLDTRRGLSANEVEELFETGGISDHADHPW